jgi:hypothetical protein
LIDGSAKDVVDAMKAEVYTEMWNRLPTPPSLTGKANAGAARKLRSKRADVVAGIVYQGVDPSKVLEELELKIKGESSGQERFRKIGRKLFKPGRTSSEAAGTKTKQDDAADLETRKEARQKLVGEIRTRGREVDTVKPPPEDEECIILPLQVTSTDGKQTLQDAWVKLSVETVRQCRFELGGSGDE